MIGQPAPQTICSECHHLYDPGTRKIACGWANVRWVTAGPELCAGCQGQIIDGMAKALPVQGGT